MPILTTFRLAAACLAAVVCLPQPAAAQQTDAGAKPHRSSLPDITGDSVERLRLAQLFGRGSRDGILIRSPSTLAGPLPGNPQRFRWSLLQPLIEITANARVPFSLNEGALWAGKGFNERVSVGARASLGPVWLTAAPEFTHSQNAPFPDPDPPPHSQPIPPGRSPYSSPWHTIPLSADLPLRFGDQAITRVDPGQSAAGVDVGRASLGIATENMWWGPGIRNAIVMSNNAPGFPHVFLRSRRPIVTRAGWFEGTWIVGGLTESAYFDNNPANNLRSLAGAALSWRLRWIPGLTVGATRTVYAPVDRWADIPPRLFNVFAGAGRPNARPRSDSTMIPGRDQVFSLFGRWVFPGDGLEVYGEWSRTEFPVSLRDWLTAPNHTQGFTLGLQWAHPVAENRPLRFQAEMTYLEQAPTFRDRPEGTYYTSRAVVQGYTNRGEVIGAAIGPGSSSQWVALDYLPPRWGVGVVAGRIRWEDDALYDLPEGKTGLTFCSHDVSLFGGMRAGTSGRIGRFDLTLLTGKRYNAFFRNYGAGACGVSVTALDIANTTLQVRFVPAW